MFWEGIITLACEGGEVNLLKKILCGSLLKKGPDGRLPYDWQREHAMHIMQAISSLQDCFYDFGFRYKLYSYSVLDNRHISNVSH